MGMTLNVALLSGCGSCLCLKRDRTRIEKVRDTMSTHRTKAVGSSANSALAYKFWVARCFRDGSPEEELFRAVCVNSINSVVTKAGSRYRQP